jgi:hypothetical protein
MAALINSKLISREYISNDLPIFPDKSALISKTLTENEYKDNYEISHQ